MPVKTDRRIRKTKAQLRTGLAKLLQKKSIKEITVKELVELVDINRSTFYLHYSDIYNMLSSIEEELLEEIRQTILNHPVSPFNESSFPFIEDIFQILEETRISAVHYWDTMETLPFFTGLNLLFPIIV